MAMKTSLPMAKPFVGTKALRYGVNEARNTNQQTGSVPEDKCITNHNLQICRCVYFCLEDAPSTRKYLSKSFQTFGMEKGWSFDALSRTVCAWNVKIAVSS